MPVAEAMEVWGESEWSAFLKQKTIMEFRIVDPANQKDDVNLDHSWGELARQMLNSFS